MLALQGIAHRKDRYPVEIDGVVHRTDGTDRDFHIGERVQIAIPRMGAVKAQVRWALPGSAGTRFLTESDF